MSDHSSAPRLVALADRMRRVANGESWSLSHEDMLAAALDRMREALEEIAKDVPTDTARFERAIIARKALRV